jgi:predicted ester cyclase
MAAVRYTMRGTTRTGKKLELPGMDFLRLKDGLIEEVWGIFDQAVLRDQLGP